MTFDDIRANRFECKELYFLFQRAELMKAEIKADVRFKDRSDREIESIVAKESFIFGRNLCRRAMIRNFHLLRWFDAAVLSEFLKFFVFPFAKLLGISCTKGVKRN